MVTRLSLFLSLYHLYSPSMSLCLSVCLPPPLCLEICVKTIIVDNSMFIFFVQYCLKCFIHVSVYKLELYFYIQEPLIWSVNPTTSLMTVVLRTYFCLHVILINNYDLFLLAPLHCNKRNLTNHRSAYMCISKGHPVFI